MEGWGQMGRNMCEVPSNRIVTSIETSSQAVAPTENAAAAYRCPLATFSFCLSTLHLFRTVAASARPGSTEVALDIHSSCHLATALCSGQHDGHQSCLPLGLQT